MLGSLKVRPRDGLSAGLLSMAVMPAMIRNLVPNLIGGGRNEELIGQENETKRTSILATPTFWCV